MKPPNHTNPHKTNKNPLGCAICKTPSKKGGLCSDECREKWNNILGTSPKTDKDLLTIAEGLAVTFNTDPHKITLWWFTPNPLLGDTIPAGLMILRPEKAKRIVKAMLEGEGP